MRKRRRPKPASQVFLFPKRGKQRAETPDEDEKLKAEWLAKNAVTRLPAGWSRYGWQ